MLTSQFDPNLTPIWIPILIPPPPPPPPKGYEEWLVHMAGVIVADYLYGSTTAISLAKTQISAIPFEFGDG